LNSDRNDCAPILPQRPDFPDFSGLACGAAQKA
jgi:hypothetical protein